MRSDVEFQSLGASLRGWPFRPPANRAPAVVMAHGFSATRSLTIDKYAEAFQSKGFAVLLFDHRGFGASGGEPRLEINPWIQTRGYLDAVELVSRADGIDPGAFRWFVEYGGTLGSNWVNDVALSLEGWQPGLCAPHLKQPVLIMVSPQDEMARANPHIARKIFDSLCGPKEWYAIGGGHFGLLYHPSELFSEAPAIQVGFLRRRADRPAQCNRNPESVRAGDLRASTSP